MHNKIYDFIINHNNVLDTEIDDVINCNADFVVFFANNENVIDNIQELKKDIENKFDTGVHISDGQIEDELNDNWEVLSIDFFIDVW